VKKNKISLDPLDKALESLKRAIHEPLNEFTRDSVIQRFEYTFELSWKILQRVLELDRPLEDRSVRNLLREAAKQGLIDDLPLWFEFQEARNLTSHTYNLKTAEEVYSVAVRLPERASVLIAHLIKRLNG